MLWRLDGEERSGFSAPLRKISADRRIMESRSVEEEEQDVTGTWDERALTLISDHIEGEGESSECWSMSCLAQFRKLLGMPTTGFEKGILALLKKLNQKRSRLEKEDQV